MNLNFVNVSGFQLVQLDLEFKSYLHKKLISILT